uniref:UBN2 domain-containing protein n=1 Tax=Tanacetum cinerariifolium TaxID=118510 RepID=A0A6L2KJW7_TANCI|nr:UBN2 domain-containing protein [Tanacetum cinerariifolium]
MHSSSLTKEIHKLRIARLIFSLKNMRSFQSPMKKLLTVALHDSILSRLVSYLDPGYYSKNHVRKFLCSLPLKWRAKVTPIEEAKDLATLPLDELIAKVARDQNSDDSYIQGESDDDVDEKEVEAFNLLARNFHNYIVDSGCPKHMTENGRLFNLYKAYDGRHVVFGSNLKGKVIGGVSFTKVDCDISKNGKLLAKGHRRNSLYTCKLRDNSKKKICLGSMVDKTTLWHGRLSHANIRFPDPKSSSWVDNDRIDEAIIQNINGSSSLQVNVLDEGYPKSLKEARGHLIEQVIGELNERTLRSKSKKS